jgi:hypothetical protein
LIEAYGMEKDKRDALEKEAQARVAGGKAVSAGAWGGVVDWRALVRRSGVSFAGYCLARTRHYTDVYDALFKEDVIARFPAVLPKVE